MAIKILVVDDEPDLELLITQKFRKKIASGEFEFVFARNGLEALKKLEETTDLEIILTDINMPEMDGLALLSNLSKLNRVYKAVVISAYGDMSNIRSAMNKGAADFVTKPIDFQDLEITINKIIEQCCHLKEGQAAKNRLRDLDKELEIARKIQQAMIPQKFDVIPGNGHFEIMGMMIPAKQVGGDFFDFFPIGDNAIGFIIADVSGKSISASLFMAITKTVFRSVALSCGSPDEALRKANTILSSGNSSCMFVTAFYGILNTETGQLNYANAGHNPPYILSDNNSIAQVGQDPSLPLGLDAELLAKSLPGYENKMISLKDRDCLFLYTDGVTEAMNRKNELYSVQRLENTLKTCGNKPLPQIIDSILNDIKAFADNVDQSDDIAILCIRYFQAAQETLSPSQFQLGNFQIDKIGDVQQKR